MIVTIFVALLAASAGIGIWAARHPKHPNTPVARVLASILNLVAIVYVFAMWTTGHWISR